MVLSEGFSGSEGCPSTSSKILLECTVHHTQIYSTSADNYDVSLSNALFFHQISTVSLLPSTEASRRHLTSTIPSHQYPKCSPILDALDPDW